MDYDEDTVLTDYVWNHYRHLMTDFERRAGYAAGVRTHLTAKEHSGLVRREVAAWFREKGSVGDTAVDAALAEGADAFRRKVRERVMAERGHEVYVNRCPACNRIVKTPKAQQRLWCGHDWHGQTA